MFFTKWKKH